MTNQAQPINASLQTQLSSTTANALTDYRRVYHHSVWMCPRMMTLHRKLGRYPIFTGYGSARRPCGQASAYTNKYAPADTATRLLDMPAAIPILCACCCSCKLLVVLPLGETIRLILRLLYPFDCCSIATHHTNVSDE